MRFNSPTLDNWAVFNDVIVGESLNHPEYETRQRVMSNKIKKLDRKLGVVFCTGDEIWQLGQPGHLGKYVDPITKRFF